MTEQRTIGYTSSDLHEIAKAVGRVTRRLKAFEAYSGSDIEDSVDNVRVDILLDGEIAGHVGYEDGWLAFFPHAIPGQEV